MRQSPEDVTNDFALEMSEYIRSVSMVMQMTLQNALMLRLQEYCIAVISQELAKIEEAVMG